MSKNSKQRTYARNRTKLSRRGFEKNPESDSVFLVKLILCALFALIWLKTKTNISIPIGVFSSFLLIYFFETFVHGGKISDIASNAIEVIKVLIFSLTGYLFGKNANESDK